MRRALITAYKRLFVRKALYGLHARLFNIGLWGMGILNSDDFHLSGELHFLRNLPKYAPVGPELVVLDVGANSGTYASAVKKIYPLSKVYAFEPQPVPFQSLSEKARKLGFQAYNLAMGEAAGQAQLFNKAGTTSQMATLFAGVIESEYGEPAEGSLVQLARLDDFIGEQQIERIGLLKIDTEGNELNVLRGAAETLKAGRIDAIQFEFNSMHVISRVFLRDIVEFLPDFRFFRLLPDGLVPISLTAAFRREIFAFQNIAGLRTAAG